MSLYYGDAHYDSLSPIKYALVRYDENGDEISVHEVVVRFTASRNNDVAITDIKYNGEEFEVTNDEGDEILHFIKSRLLLNSKQYYIGLY